MIVDDEKLICKLVQALVEWDKLGMQMAAQAENDVLLNILKLIINV